MRPSSLDNAYAAEMNRLGKAWLESQGCTSRRVIAFPFMIRVSLTIHASRWVGTMDSQFNNHGLRVRVYKRLPINTHMNLPWTEMQIMANRDFAENGVIPSTQNNPSLPSAEVWREMLRGVEKEAQSGLRILTDMYIS
jgi:hypothetical protein